MNVESNAPVVRRLPLVATVVSMLALVVSGLTYMLAVKSYELTPKRELLKTLMGTRYVLTAPLKPKRDEELGNTFYTALNQASVVFSDDEHVLEALRVFDRNVHNTENLTDVLRAMAVAADVEDSYHFEDEKLMQPFGPGDG